MKIKVGSLFIYFIKFYLYDIADSKDINLRDKERELRVPIQIFLVLRILYCLESKFFYFE